MTTQEVATTLENMEICARNKDKRIASLSADLEEVRGMLKAKNARIAELELGMSNHAMDYDAWHQAVLELERDKEHISELETAIEGQKDTIAELKETLRLKTSESNMFRGKMFDYKNSVAFLEMEFQRLKNPLPNRFVMDFDRAQVNFIIESLTYYHLEITPNNVLKAMPLFKMLRNKFQFIQSQLEGNDLETAINNLEL